MRTALLLVLLSSTLLEARDPDTVLNLWPGKPPGPLRDTLLMDRDEVAEIAFVADNPGKWLLHCHMLEHSVGGMMTWLRVG